MWDALYRSHEAARDVATVDVARMLRERVKGLVARAHCDQRFQGKVTYKQQSARGRREIWVKGGEDAMGAPIPLEGLPELTDAKLSFAVMLDDRERRVEKFTVRLDGRTRATGQPWLVAVEMDDRPLGSGACGHALIHCHVGPDHVSTPEVRVPCPPMKPWDALDWVLTLVVPGWEPLPWDGGAEAEPSLPADVVALRRAWRDANNTKR